MQIHIQIKFTHTHKLALSLSLTCPVEVAAAGSVSVTMAPSKVLAVDVIVPPAHPGQWTNCTLASRPPQLCCLRQSGINIKSLNSKVMTDSFQLTPAPPKQRRWHFMQLTQILCHTAYRQVSFFPATIKDRNDLPEGTVTASTPDTFVSRVPQRDSNTNFFFFFCQTCWKWQNDQLADCGH